MVGKKSSITAPITLYLDDSSQDLVEQAGARGLEDMFYLPDGAEEDLKTPLIEKLAQYARNAGREVASPQEARGMLGLKPVEAVTAP